MVPLELPLQVAEAPGELPIVMGITIPPPTSEDPHRYLCPTQFRVWIPENAVSLVIEVEPSIDTPANLDLYIRYGSKVTEDEEYVYFSAADSGPGSFKRIELSEATDPSLIEGPLFIALGSLADDRLPVLLRMTCVVSELPEGLESDSSGLLNIPFVLVNVDNRFRMTVPAGWNPLPEAPEGSVVLATFETPRVDGQPTAGRIEVSTWPLNEVSDVDELRRRLDLIYTSRGGLELVTHGEATIDGHEARSSLLVDAANASATLAACFIKDSSAWLISVTFSPLGYGSMYERVFESAIGTFQLDPEKEG